MEKMLAEYGREKFTKPRALRFLRALFTELQVDIDEGKLDTALGSCTSYDVEEFGPVVSRFLPSC